MNVWAYFAFGFAAGASVGALGCFLVAYYLSCRELWKRAGRRI